MRPMFLIHNVVSLTALTCVVCSPAAHAQVTLDFENFSNPNSIGGANSYGYTVTQDGFTVTDSAHYNGLYSVAPNGSANYTGSVALLNGSNGASTVLTQNNGNVFSINSIDIANVALQSVQRGGDTIVFTGHIQSGGSVTQTFTHGANDKLETIVFSSEFINLTSLSLFDAPSNGHGYQLDNVVLNIAAVPEPGLVALSTCLGVVGAGFFTRHRKL